MEILNYLLEHHVETIIGGVIVSTVLVFWNLWHAYQMNEIEVLLAGTEWQKKKEIARASTIFIAMYLFNWSIGISSEDVALVISFLTLIFMLIFFVLAIVNIFAKSQKVTNVSNAFFMLSIICLGLICSKAGYEYTFRKGMKFPVVKYVVFLGLILTITLMVGFCLLMLLSTFRKTSHILLTLRKYEPTDSQLFVYSRLGDDLICGDNSDIFKAKNIITVPVEEVKKEKYSFSMNATSEEEKSTNKIPKEKVKTKEEIEKGKEKKKDS